MDLVRLDRAPPRVSPTSPTIPATTPPPVLPATSVVAHPLCRARPALPSRVCATRPGVTSLVMALRVFVDQSLARWRPAPTRRPAPAATPPGESVVPGVTTDTTTAPHKNCTAIPMAYGTSASAPRVPGPVTIYFTIRAVPSCWFALQCCRSWLSLRLPAPCSVGASATATHRSADIRDASNAGFGWGCCSSSACWSSRS